MEKCDEKYYYGHSEILTIDYGKQFYIALS